MKRKARLLVRGDLVVDTRAVVRGRLADDAIVWTTPDGLVLVDLRVGRHLQQWGADADVEIEPRDG